MRAQTLQVSWHGGEPVLSLDFSPSGLLATGGLDKTVRLWKLVVHPESPDTPPTLAFVYELKHHTTAINAVRFSPDGCTLASGADDGHIILWRPAPHEPPPLLFGTEANKDNDPAHLWRPRKHCRGITGDVSDLSWAADSSALAAGTLSNELNLVNNSNGDVLARYHHHVHFVQGVSWSPRGDQILTMSLDKSLKAYCLKEYAGQGSGAKKPRGAVGLATRAAEFNKPDTLRMRPFLSSRTQTPATETDQPPPGPSGQRRISDQGTITNHHHHHHNNNNNMDTGGDQPQPPVGDGDPTTALDGTHDGTTRKRKKERYALFHDEQSVGFYRRLAFSPCGSFAVAPAGLLPTSPKDDQPRNCTYVLSRNDLMNPVAVLLGPTTPTVAVRFCPVPFALRAMSTKVEENPVEPQITPSETAATATGEPPTTITAATTFPHTSSPFLDLPARFAFAVASKESVFVYHTESAVPVAVAGGLHFAEITDLAWTPDGTSLVVSSRDGYCSVLTFSPHELGVTLSPEEVPAEMRGVLYPTPATAKVTKQKTPRGDQEGEAPKDGDGEDDDDDHDEDDDNDMKEGDGGQGGAREPPTSTVDPAPIAEVENGNADPLVGRKRINPTPVSGPGPVRKRIVPTPVTDRGGNP